MKPKIAAQYITYDEKTLGDNPQRFAQILRRILSEALHLIPNDGENPITKKNIEEAHYRNLRMAVEGLCGGPVAITVLEEPFDWHDLLKEGTAHYLFEDWTDNEQRRQTWLAPTDTRIVWHVESGLVTASKTKTPESRTHVQFWGERFQVFLWNKKNLIRS